MKKFLKKFSAGVVKVTDSIAWYLTLGLLLVVSAVFQILDGQQVVVPILLFILGILDLVIGVCKIFKVDLLEKLARKIANAIKERRK